MNLDDYQHEAVTTAVGDSLQERAILGVYGELEEYRASQRTSELGDIMWYCALLCHTHNISLARCTRRSPSKLSDIAETRKKYLRGDFGYDEYIRRLRHGISAIVTFCTEEAGGELSQLLQDNLDKLKKRAANDSLRGDGEER